MKFFVVASALDLNLRLGCTPSWWQLFKALAELGHELVVTPYIGDPVDSLWWRTTRNPTNLESKVMNGAIKRGVIRPIGTQPLAERVTMQVIKHYIRPRWRRHILDTLAREEDVDVLWFINAPLNHLTGIPTEAKRRYPDLKALYYDGDMPSILPGYFEDRKFKMAYYNGADLSEYDAFFTNSEGVMPALRDLGARNVQPLHYAVDPDLFSPIQAESDTDVFYYAHGSEAREQRIDFMITRPSRALPQTDFLVAGKAFDVDLGAVRREGVLSINDWRVQACKSKINLNVTRSTHATVYASSTARLFELASLGCCVVSDPYDGLASWFRPGSELHVVESADEACETYTRLLADDAARCETGAAARAAVVARHTYQHRARQVLSALRCPHHAPASAVLVAANSVGGRLD
jgi:hypothetical protein